jgi:uncharacterized protein (DUF4415 family)
VTPRCIKYRKHAPGIATLVKIATAGIFISSVMVSSHDDQPSRNEDLMQDKRFRATSSRDAAEAAFKKTTSKPVEPVESGAKPPSIPGAKEQVSLRIDREVLDYFQEAGPGW